MRVVDIPNGYQFCPKCNERSIDILKTIDRTIIFKCQNDKCDFEVKKHLFELEHRGGLNG